MDEAAAPHNKIHLWWDDVAGATSYNVYRAGSDGQTCPTFYYQVASTPDNYFLDDPAPTWYQLPVTQAWGVPMFCYGVSAIVNGVEGAIVASNIAAIGLREYVNLTFTTDCRTGSTIVPFPYTHNEIQMSLIYRGSDNVNHPIPFITVHYPYQGTPQNQEWEFRLPVQSSDGTMIPLSKDGYYYYQVTTPDGGYWADTILREFPQDGQYYVQIDVSRQLNDPNPHACGSAMWGPFGSYQSWWQNVLR